MGARARELVAALKALADLAAQEPAQRVASKLLKLATLDQARRLQSRMLSSSTPGALDVFVFNTLIELFSKCGSNLDASRVFHRMPSHNLVSWNLLLLAYAGNGDEHLALQIFSQSVLADPSSPLLTSRTLVAALKACSTAATKERGHLVSAKLVKLNALTTGMELHSLALRSGLILVIFVANSLIDMYSSCSNVLDAAIVFDRMPEHDVVSWTSIISAFAESGEPKLGLDLFFAMAERGLLDVGAFIAGLKACAGAAAIESATLVHGKLVKLSSLGRAMELHSMAEATRCIDHLFVSNALVDLYANCGTLLDSRRAFDRMKLHTPVSWTSLLVGYVENGEPALALQLFSILFSQRSPDPHAFVAALKACGSTADVEKLAKIHSRVCRSGLETEPLLANSLVDVYGKCGCMDAARHVFDSLARTDTAAWNGLISGYSRHGESEAALELFHDMREQGCEVDEMSFVSLLSACGHHGLVERGHRCFDAMLRDPKYAGVRPRPEHYGCMVDLLGRSNRLDAAVALARSMPSAATWTNVLAAAHKWNNVDVARTAFDELESLGNAARDSATYMLMANVLNKSSTALRVLMPSK